MADHQHTPNRDKAQRILNDLLGDVGACCAFLVNLMGHTVLRAGEQETLPMDEINALLGGSISALVQAGKTLDDQQHDFNLVYQREGSKHHLFSINVGEKLLMTLLIPKTKFGVQVGGVMHYSRRVARELNEILGGEDVLSKPSELPEEFREEDFDSAIADSIDALFSQTEEVNDFSLGTASSDSEDDFVVSWLGAKRGDLLSYEEAVQKGIFPEHKYFGVKEGERN